MRLYILRHGEASFDASTDEMRELTPRGYEETRWVLERYKNKIPADSVFLVSPLVRAQQTAAIAQQVLGFGEPVVSENLRPESNLTTLLDRFPLYSANNIFMVSHQPLVGRLVNDLTGSEPNRHMMGTSSLACLEGDDILPGCMDLIFLKHRGDLR